MPYNSAYHRMMREELEELYKRGEKGLTVSGTISMTEIEEELQKLKEELSKTQKTITSLTNENIELKSAMSEIKNIIEGTEKALSTLVSAFENLKDDCARLKELSITTTISFAGVSFFSLIVHLITFSIKFHTCVC